MKLLRYGPKGQEKPGLLDGQGTIRSLEGHVDDIAGDALSPDGLRRLAGINASELKAVDGQPRLGALRRPARQVHLHRPQLFRPRRRDRR